MIRYLYHKIEIIFKFVLIIIIIIISISIIIIIIIIIILFATYSQDNVVFIVNKL